MKTKDQKTEIKWTSVDGKYIAQVSDLGAM